MSIRIGVDLGGTKIEVAALNERGETLVRRRVATPLGDYAATVDAVARLVQDTERDLNVTATVGIGTPGAVSYETGLMKNANSTVLIGKPLKADLERKLGREIRMTNDANCLVLSEAVDGAARDARVAFGVILGTGVGGGIVVDKHIIDGANAIAGEWGHNPLPWPQPDELPGAKCYCGKYGCVETFLSGPALSRDYESCSGERAAATVIAVRAQSGDVDAQRCMQAYEDRLARALATVVNILDPDVIVFGGGVSNIERLYASTPSLLGRYVFSDTVRTQVRQADHGDSSGVRGAAMLWP